MIGTNSIRAYLCGEREKIRSQEGQQLPSTLYNILASVLDYLASSSDQCVNVPEWLSIALGFRKIA